MAHAFHSIAFTDAVKAVQAENGSRALYQGAEADPAKERTAFGADEAGFIGDARSFYLATTSETGWPYMQHRGGPAGFLKILSPTRLGFADFAGNRQYVTLGNLTGNDRVMLFLMSYEHKARMKIFGRARVVTKDTDAALIKALTVEGYRARVERGIVIDVEGFDWNCRQHIPERFERQNVIEAVQQLQAKIAVLEAELKQARGQTT
jgi:uncharacterized protein